MCPVAGKGLLHLLNGGALHTQHDVNPGGKAWLDAKGFIGTVLAANVGDLLIDQGDLAVVAQVDAAGQDDFERAINGQGDRQVHAATLHLLPQRRMGQGARAQSVDHGTAGDAALGCAY